MSGNWLGSSGRTLEPLRLIRALNWKVHEHQGHCPQLSDLYINLQIPADAHVDMSNAYWKNILWTDKTKTELFGNNVKRYVGVKVRLSIRLYHVFISL